MGGTTVCANADDTYQYIHISANQWNDELCLCGVGIFTCPCSNYIGYRENDISESIEVDFRTSDQATITKLTGEIAAASTKGSCVKACTKGMRATLDADLISTATATVT